MAMEIMDLEDRISEEDTVVMAAVLVTTDKEEVAQAIAHLESPDPLDTAHQVKSVLLPD